jgi:hypothetical protein
MRLWFEALPNEASEANNATHKYKECTINKMRVKQEVNKFKG